MLRHLAILCILLTGVTAACGDGEGPSSPSPTVQEETQEAETPVASPSRETPIPETPITETPAWETPSPQTLTPDSSLVIGDVDYVEFPALLDGIEASVNDDIHPRSVIETHERGIADFHTDDVAGCDTRGDSQLQIRPNDRLAIKWLPGKSGESFCNKLPGQGKQTYGIGDAIEILLRTALNMPFHPAVEV